MNPISSVGLSDITAIRGKSAESVGHMAKDAVAQAREAGVDLPRNAQGLAASQIAKGADWESVFAAQIAELVEPVETGVEEATEGYEAGALAGEATEESDDPTAGTIVTDLVGTGTGSEEETALMLLETASQVDRLV